MAQDPRRHTGSIRRDLSKKGLVLLFQKSRLCCLSLISVLLSLTQIKIIILYFYYNILIEYILADEAGGPDDFLPAMSCNLRAKETTKRSTVNH